MNDEQGAGAREESSGGKKIEPARAKKIMKETFQLLKQLGGGAGDLYRRLKKDRSPEAMLETMDQQLTVIKKRRDTVAGELDRLHSAIVAGKKKLQSATPARKKILENELLGLLTDYKARERELKVLLENERNLSRVRGRIYELQAYGMAGLTEDAVDDLISEIDEKAGDADLLSDAMRDLDGAGKRRERESDREDLLGELAAFEEESGAEEAAGSLDRALEEFSEVPEEPVRNKERE
jgi:predicted  nucleic acid-binding Zn-ribbon protein